MAHWSRRNLLHAGLSGAGIAAAGISLPTRAEASPERSLDALARAKGLIFGTSMGTTGGNRPQELEDPRYVELVLAECGIIVPENELKMTVVQPRPAEFRLERADRLVAFAEANKLLVRGHTFLWHHPRWLPPWLEAHDFGPRPAEAAEKLLVEHIHTVGASYGKRICSWDVVNEAVHNITGEMRETAFSRAIGTPDKVLEIAFHAAQQACPESERIYNDYMGWEDNNAAQRDGVLRLLERFRKNKVPVDALGLQAHIGAGNQDSNAGRGFDARDERAWRKFLEEVTGMGYKLLITEFDVHDTPLPAAFAARDREVAALTKGFLDLTLSFEQVHTVMCWGLVDSQSWLQGRTPRPDGKPKRPNPFDAEYRAKPLRAALAAALRSAPMRTSPFRTAG